MKDEAKKERAEERRWDPPCCEATRIRQWLLRPEESERPCSPTQALSQSHSSRTPCPSVPTKLSDWNPQEPVAFPASAPSATSFSSSARWPAPTAAQLPPWPSATLFCSFYWIIYFYFCGFWMWTEKKESELGIWLMSGKKQRNDSAQWEGIEWGRVHLSSEVAVWLWVVGNL